MNIKIKIDNNHFNLNNLLNIIKNITKISLGIGDWGLAKQKIGV